MDNIIFASRFGAALDSDVINGGGTDDTKALQAALDTAARAGHLRLVLDGAALISAPLRIYSNTTILCPDRGCGVFLRAGSDCCMLRNAHWRVDGIEDENIELIGGTWNHNAAGQIHDHGEGDEARGEDPLTSWVIGFKFYGVRGLTARDLTIMNQRTFTVLMANWERVTMENVHIDLRQYMSAQNQDGLHFFGPGRHLTLRNISGRSGDDFIALAPDEVDLKSSITDVSIDGVTLMDADQGIRLLCRGDGTLDRVAIRHVSGTFRGFGFYINPWFESDTGGHYGHILMEDVDLEPLAPAYDYHPPYLFHVGGTIDSLVLKDVYLRQGRFPVEPLIVGGQYATDSPATPRTPTRVGNLVLDGVEIADASGGAAPPHFAHVRAPVGSLTIRNARFTGSPRPGAALLKLDEDGAVGRLTLRDVETDAALCAPDGRRRVETIITDNAPA